MCWSLWGCHMVSFICMRHGAAWQAGSRWSNSCSSSSEELGPGPQMQEVRCSASAEDEDHG